VPDIVETLASFFVAEETSFASGGTDVRAHPVAESVTPERSQEVLPVKTLRIRPNDVRSGVKSYKGGSLKFTYLLQPAADVLDEAAVVPSGASKPPLWVLMHALMGGQSVEAGSAVDSGTSATQFAVNAGHGARFPAGQLCLVEDGANGLVACRVTERATDALKVYPALSATPSAAAEVINAVTWYPTRTNSKSLRCRLAYAQDANYQLEFIGGTGGFELKFARNELAAADFNLEFASHTGPSAQGISTAHAEDSMAEPLACRNAILYMNSVGLATRNATDVEAVTVALNLGNKHVECLTGGTEGKRAVMRSEGLQDAVATVELTFAANTTMDNIFANGTEMSLIVVIPVDTDEGRRAIIVDVPRATMEEQPKYMRGANQLLKVTAKFTAKLDNACTGTLDNEQLAQAGIRIGIA
jgi:hypothetical protein